MKIKSRDELEKLLTPVNQLHLLRFWPQLDAAGRERLARAVTALELERIPLMQRLAAETVSAPAGAIEPAPVRAVSGAERQRARAAGTAALAEGKVAVLLVAGGQGSRLGFDGPKGAFPLGPVSGVSLFEIHARKILALEKRYGGAIPFLVMTSCANDEATRVFFERSRYFGLDPERVHFFQQGMLPAMLPDGRLALETPDRLFLAPDGHGGVLAAMKKAGLFAELTGRGVETVFYFQVDNPMVQVAAPDFIGIHRLRRAQVSVKVCAKRSPDEGLGVVTLRDGRMTMVEYSELTDEQKNARNPDGTLRFGSGSVAIHVFDLDFLAQQSECDLPLHRAFKKIPVCGDDGQTQQPVAPNGFKFEKFIFDVLPRADRVALVPFDRTAEFAPVKNADGEDSPATARRAMVADAARRLEDAGVAVPYDAGGNPRFALEIDPVFAAGADELRNKLMPDFRIDNAVYLR